MVSNNKLVVWVYLIITEEKPAVKSKLLIRKKEEVIVFSEV